MQSVFMGSTKTLIRLRGSRNMADTLLFFAEKKYEYVLNCKANSHFCNVFEKKKKKKKKLSYNSY